jgi:Icc protein
MILGQISDFHIKAHGRKSYRVVDTAESLRRCVAHVMNLKQRPDAIAMTGDLVDSGGPEEYVFLRRLLAPLTMPYYLIPGNHDERAALRAAFPEHEYLRQNIERFEYVIDEHDLRIVALDTVVPGESGGRLDSESMQWLDRILGAQPRRPTVLIMHHPPFKTWIGHIDKVGLANPEILHSVVARHPQVERVLCGHLHRSIQVRFAGTIASTCPSPAHQIDLDLIADGRPQFVMEPPGYQLHVWNPKSGIVSHTAYIGEFDGPYPFYDAAGLID